ncbi:hypothetical protein B6I21_07515 [candidate division KSB1 bacterium 4572_119]|nr:MAG: hypothetical protein B6I21_07515 [candidate division KSB1 bacterium 4572_119]
MKKIKIISYLLALFVVLLLVFTVYAYTTYTSVVSIPSGTGTDTDNFHTAVGKDNNDVWWFVEFEAKSMGGNSQVDVEFSVYPSNEPGSPDIHKTFENYVSGQWTYLSDGSEDAMLTVPDADYTTKLRIGPSFCYYRNAEGTVSNIWVEE